MHATSSTVATLLQLKGSRDLVRSVSASSGAQLLWFWGDQEPRMVFDILDHAQQLRETIPIDLAIMLRYSWHLCMRRILLFFHPTQLRQIAD